jgi:hypothetical protein
VFWVITNLVIRFCLNLEVNKVLVCIDIELGINIGFEIGIEFGIGVGIGRSLIFFVESQSKNIRLSCD